MTQLKRLPRVAKAAAAAVVVASAHTGLVLWLWMHLNPYVPASLGLRAMLVVTAAIGPAFFFALNLGVAVVFVLNAVYLTALFWLATMLWGRRRRGEILAPRTS